MEMLPVAIFSHIKPYLGTIRGDIEEYIINRIVGLLLQSKRCETVSDIYPNIQVYIWRNGWEIYDIGHLQRIIQSQYIDEFDEMVGI